MAGKRGRFHRKHTKRTFGGLGMRHSSCLLSEIDQIADHVAIFWEEKLVLQDALKALYVRPMALVRCVTCYFIV